MFSAVKTLNSTTFASLRIRNYRLYFIGQAISLSGTWLQTIGQAWLVLRLTGSGTDLGFVTALQFLPVLVLGSYGGVIADRYPKRRLLFFTQSSAAILALILALLVASHDLHLWMIYVLAFCLGLVNVVDNPTRQTFVMELVGREHLPNAITLNSIELNLARVIGPALAGILIANLGYAPCFFINSFSYLAVLACLAMMITGDLYPTSTAKPHKGQLREGIRYVWNTPVLRNVLLMMAAIGTLAYEFQITLPLFAEYTLKGSISSYAILTAAMSIGAVIGGVITAGRKQAQPRALSGIAVVFGISIIAASLAPNLATAVILMTVVGICSISFTALASATLQLQTTPEMRGRVMALWAIAFLGSTPIGGPIVGWLSEHTNPRIGLLVGGATAVIAGIIGIFAMRNYTLVKINLGTIKQRASKIGQEILSRHFN